MTQDQHDELHQRVIDAISDLCKSRNCNPRDFAEMYLVMKSRPFREALEKCIMAHNEFLFDLRAQTERAIDNNRIAKRELDYMDHYLKDFGGC